MMNQIVPITNKNKINLYQIIALANLQAKEIGKRQFSYLLIEDRDGDIIIPDSVWTTKKQ